MRVVVTGGSGFVGSVVCRRLAQSHDVIVFDTKPPDSPGVSYLRGDILNSADLMYAMRGADAVVHLAAIPHPAIDSADAIMQTNVMGTQRVVEAAALGSPRRLVLASSDSAFGFVFGRGLIAPQYVPVDEAHPSAPLDPYGLSKLLGEEICRRYSRDMGLETVCLRYCWVWTEALYGRLEELASQPELFVGQLWGYIDARDVAQAVEKSLLAEGLTHETLCIGAARTFQREPSLDLVRRFLGDGVQVRDEASFRADPHRALISNARAAERIGFAPEYDCRREAGLEP